MLAVGIVIVALVVALLAVPVVLVLDVERVETLEARWRVRWLFGLVDVQSSRRQRKGSPSERSETATSRHKSPKERRSRARMGIAVLRTRGLLRRVGRLVVTLFRQVTFEEVRLRTTFGLEDPADTGIVYGFLTPLLVVAKTRGLNVDCRPMFLDSGWNGTVSATIHVRPVSVLAALVVFLVSPPVIRALGVAWQARK